MKRRGIFRRMNGAGRDAVSLGEMSRLINLKNRVFGFLEVLSRVPVHSRNGSKWLCRCGACGKIVIVPGFDIRRGHQISCGCQRLKPAKAEIGNYSLRPANSRGRNPIVRPRPI